MELFSVFMEFAKEWGSLTASIGWVRRRILGCESISKVGRGGRLGSRVRLRGSKSLLRV